MRLLIALLVLASCSSAIGAPVGQEAGGGKSSQKYAKPIKPYTIDQLRRMPVQAYHKINHENHLKDLSKSELAEFSDPLLRYTSHLLDVRTQADAAIQQHGGETGRIFSGSQQAHGHHMNYAGAQNGLHQLSAPLNALQHAATKVGDRQTELLAKSYLTSVKLDNSIEKSENHIGREYFKHMIGQESVYTRKQGRWVSS